MVGSNIANILLILGLTAVISPLLVDPKALLRDGPANFKTPARQALSRMKVPEAKKVLEEAGDGDKQE